jgi:uncharacterized protein YpmB
VKGKFTPYECDHDEDDSKIIIIIIIIIFIIIIQSFPWVQTPSRACIDYREREGKTSTLDAGE